MARGLLLLTALTLGLAMPTAARADASVAIGAPGFQLFVGRPPVVYEAPPPVVYEAPPAVVYETPVYYGRPIYRPIYRPIVRYHWGYRGHGHGHWKHHRKHHRHWDD